MTTFNVPKINMQVARDELLDALFTQGRLSYPAMQSLLIAADLYIEMYDDDQEEEK